MAPGGVAKSHDLHGRQHQDGHDGAGQIWITMCE